MKFCFVYAVASISYCKVICFFVRKLVKSFKISNVPLSVRTFFDVSVHNLGKSLFEQQRGDRSPRVCLVVPLCIRTRLNKSKLDKVRKWVFKYAQHETWRKDERDKLRAMRIVVFKTHSLNEYSVHPAFNFTLKINYKQVRNVRRSQRQLKSIWNLLGSIFSLKYFDVVDST